ncbi:MAG: hypothetical protein REI64_14035 [Pedobacter sp.]|uniref:hypothetical protein n=1 Tax=Pedobacter sp. TaxID=1411316 RepID=UPI0028090141|nr:hypothetical protein [Pedobacter sp.]MDQ8005918.1 hypothetical protein [Pedobacter sp.]
METNIKQQQTISFKNICVQFMLSYQQQNIAKMLNCCDAEGLIDFIPLGESGKGKIHELGKAIWSMLLDSFPDLDNTLDAAVADDKNTVRCQVVIRGTQAKDFAGIENKGEKFDSDHIFIFRISQNNLIDYISVNWNHADFAKQLGTVI